MSRPDSSSESTEPTQVVRAALVQATWTGDTESMIAKHEEHAREAAAQGAQDHRLPGGLQRPLLLPGAGGRALPLGRAGPGRSHRARGCRTSPRETGMVIVVPVFEVEQPGVYYNTAAVIDADGSYLGKYRKHHIPQVKGFWEKYYFKPGNLGWPVFDTAVGRIGVYICYDRHFPEGWRALGLAGAQIVYNPSRHQPRPVRRTCGSWSSPPPPSPTSTSSPRSTGSAARSTATTTSTAPATSSTRAASSSAAPPPTRRRNCSSATWTSA